MTPYRRLARALKAFRMRWTGATRSWFWAGAPAPVDYARAVGDGRSSAVVMACVLWLCRTFPEAPIQVARRQRDGSLETVPRHALTQLITTPNPAYSGVLLWMATIGDWMTTGNAYWAKVRSANGRVAEIWWLPASLVEPRWPDDGKAYVSHYEYRVGADVVRLAVADVVHFRYGLDPQNPRKGLSPLAALLREVYTDEEAAAYTATLLRNVGVPGVVLSPEFDVPREQMLETKQWIEDNFASVNRGKPMIMPSKTTATRLGFNPSEMDLKDLRRIPEERVSAIFGIPAVVVGLGAGLDRSTFANYEEARQAAYESNVIPTQRLFAAELQTQLLPDVGDAGTEVVGFDLADVRVLQPDLDKLVERLDRAVQGGWMLVNEARAELGMDALPEGDLLYVTNTKTPTDPAELLTPPEPVEPPPDALAEPTPLRALPPPKGPGRPVARTKARRTGMVAGVTRLRRRYEAPMAADVAAYLDGQLERAAGRLGVKEVTRLPDADEAELAQILAKWYARVLPPVAALAEDELGALIDLGRDQVAQYLLTSSANVRGITETTRLAVRQALLLGQAAGEGPDALARRLRADAAFAPSRARTIARTELGYATQYAAVDTYRASGLVTHVTVHDGTDDGACAAANGQTWTLEEARGRPLEHPQCTRAFAPVVGEAAA